MAWWKRRSIQDIGPWQGGGLRAEPTSPGPKAVPAVLLSAGELRVAMPVRDLWLFGRETIECVSPIGEETVFLARVRASAPSSVSAPQVRGLPADAVVLLPANPKRPPAAVLTDATAMDFLSWARRLMA